MDESVQDNRICAQDDLHEQVRRICAGPEQEHEELFFAGWKRIFPALTDSFLPFTVHESVNACLFPISFHLFHQSLKLFDTKSCQGFKVSFVLQRLVEDAHRML